MDYTIHIEEYWYSELIMTLRMSRTTLELFRWKSMPRNLLHHQQTFITKTIGEVLVDHSMVGLRLKTQEALMWSQDSFLMRNELLAHQNQLSDKGMELLQSALEVVECQILDHLENKKKVIKTNLIKVKRINNSSNKYINKLLILMIMYMHLRIKNIKIKMKMNQRTHKNCVNHNW